MITGNCEREIKYYIMIDRGDEHTLWIEAVTGTETEGEEIIGIPYGFYNDNSTPFIEHRKNGIVTKTINCSDVSKIEFWIHIKPYIGEDDE